jgi:uncharacterized membrane protein (Fun14 family)
MSETQEAARSAKPPMSPLKKAALVGIVLVLVLSVVGRAFFSDGGSGGGASQSGGGKASVAPSSVGGAGFVPGGQGGATGAEASEPEGEVAKALPYVTEGSFFALIGFALGYASRKLVKVGLVFLAIFFVGLQVLAYMDVVNVDWGRGVEVVNEFVLNIQEGDSIKKILTDKLPTAGGLAAGYFLGFRKG